MKTRFAFLLAALLTAALLTACNSASGPAPSVSSSEPAAPSAPSEPAESSEASAVPDSEPAGDTPVGEFWSLPDDTPFIGLMEEYPDFDLMSIPPIRPETAEEGETVGKIKAWWQSLSPDDERLRTHYLTMTPEEKVLEIEHENPVLTAVGDIVEGVYGETPVSVTAESVQADGYVAVLELRTSGVEAKEIRFDYMWEDKSPGYSHGANGYSGGATEDESRSDYRFYAATPFVQLAEQAEAPFPFDLDIRLEGMMVESKTAVFPKVDNTREGLAPLSAQISPLSFAVTFAAVGVPLPEEPSDMQPVRLLCGEEAVYTFGGDSAYNQNITPIGITYVPVREETATIAGEYDWREAGTLLVCADEAPYEIFPDYDRVDAIEFEGVVYPLS